MQSVVVILNACDKKKKKKITYPVIAGLFILFYYISRVYKVSCQDGCWLTLRHGMTFEIKQIIISFPKQLYYVGARNFTRDRYNINLILGRIS